MTLYLPVLQGSARTESWTRYVARFVVDRLEAQPKLETDLFDAGELPLGNLDEREWEMDPRPAEVARFVDAMERAHGFVVCTPEYNHGYPGALKNLFDHVYDEWNRKPFGFVTTGGSSGGLRAAEQLRGVVGGLGAVSVPYVVAVQRVRDVFGPDGCKDPDTWGKRIDRLADEISWYASALRSARQAD